MNLRETIIHESLKLFSLKGYLTTTINDIIEAAKTSKGGFYNHFSSKDDLFNAVLAEARNFWRERVLDGLDEIVKPSNQLIQLLENYSLHYLKDSDNIPGGCIFLTLAVELNDQRPDLAKKVNEGIFGLKKKIKRLLDQAVMVGEFREDVDTEKASMIILSGFLGSSVLFAMEKAKPVLDHAINSVIDYIQSLKFHPNM